MGKCPSNTLNWVIRWKNVHKVVSVDAARPRRWPRKPNKVKSLCMSKKKAIPGKYQVWIEARKKYHLSHVHIQMARELGLNPKKFGGIANHRQEPWKAPLPEFIADLYFKRFGRRWPDEVKSIEQIVQETQDKKKSRSSEHQ